MPPRQLGETLTRNFLFDLKNGTIVHGSRLFAIFVKRFFYREPQAYIFNATVVPPGSMPFLTLWPNLENQPVVSTLNAADGFTTSNMAIVPTNNGSIDAYAQSLTQLILDISGYFAP